MSSSRDTRYPPGRQPYDAFIGLRVGGLLGALIGAVVTAVTGVGVVWYVAGFAVLGGVVGYLVETRAVARERSDDV